MFPTQGAGGQLQGLHMGCSQNHGPLLGIYYMGGCQNYCPFLGTLNIRGRIIIGIQKGTIILTTTHIMAPNIEGYQNGTLILGTTHMYVQFWICSEKASGFRASLAPKA